jgi:hypothetical protein
MRTVAEWLLVRLSAVLAAVVIPDPTDGVWDTYEEEGL